MSRDDATLLDIYHAAQDVLEFQEGLTEEEFQADKKTQSAIVHKLLIIGEATKRLSDAFRKDHPSIPWRPMAGMRDRLIHDYNNVDLEEVWRTVQRDIPELLEALDPLLPDRGAQEEGSASI